MTRAELWTILSLGCPQGVQDDERIAFMRSIESHGGWLFRTEIEGVWATFPEPIAALCSVAEILHEFPHTRAGVECGEVALTEDGDLLGHTLSVAKRLEMVCPLGKAYLGQELRTSVRCSLYFCTISAPLLVTLKGLGEYSACELTPYFLHRKRAFKFLDSYCPADQNLFFGREAEAEKLCRGVKQNTWFTLYGHSGVGKSSLLGAGLFPELEAEGFEIFRIRCLSEPLQLLKNQFRIPRGGSFADALESRLIQKSLPGLLFCFDQFEEFWLRVNQEDRRLFWRSLKALLRDPRLQSIRWLFSLREDFLAEMGEAEDEIEGFLDCQLRLTPLTREQAKACIEGPAQRCGRWVEPELVQAILDDLYRTGVDPPELQIVLDRLDQTRDTSSRWVTLEAYQQLGGFQEILVDYLYEVLQGVKDEKLTKNILLVLVTEVETKRALSPAEMSQALGISVEQVSKQLTPLLDSRVVRILPNDGYVELAHEYLIEEIRAWADEAELAARYARLALDSEVESWTKLGSLMDQERLQLLVDHKASLHPSPPEKEILLRACFTHGLSPSGWLDPVSHADFLLRLLDEVKDGTVQRRVMHELSRIRLSDLARLRLVQAGELFGNPTFLAELIDPDEGLKNELKNAISRRFFGHKKMVMIPSGAFLFGSTKSNKVARQACLHRYLHPKIQSEADLGTHELEDYWMDICPVTNSEFAEFQPAHSQRFPAEEADHPVVSLTLLEAESYASWLGKELPTEEEWEKAARGTDGRLFPWGNEYDIRHLNGAEDQFKQTTPVGTFPSGISPYGCLDMAGNVWEWTVSSWSQTGPFIVQKGGSTICDWPQQQSSSRMDAFPDFVLRWTGFRLKSDASARQENQQ